MLCSQMNLSNTIYTLFGRLKQFFTGACPGFLKGGGPISLGSLKKGHQILKGGGSNGLKGGVQYICLTMTTNLAYLDAKE